MLYAIHPYGSGMHMSCFFMFLISSSCFFRLLHLLFWHFLSWGSRKRKSTEVHLQNCLKQMTHTTTIQEIFKQLVFILAIFQILAGSRVSPPPSHHSGAPTLSKYSVRKASKPLLTPPLARLELWHGFAVTVAYPPIVDL